ncbi:hypothetical protein J3Q64DRAFT_1765567 [Phycomyces blakesleeanus]|uniref:Plasma membrane proteolipid 3 n=1 Tax=Phycomyces blakesleeanus TaxID=4837 RepID=A0ABR3AR29_PHYBL
MALTCSDIFKFFFAVILPPLGVMFEKGCGCDFVINICLTCLGYIPGISKFIHDIIYNTIVHDANFTFKFMPSILS